MNQAVLGVGLDVCDVNRIAKLRKKSAFIYEIMSPTEAAAPPRSDEEIAFLWATKRGRSQVIRYRVLAKEPGIFRHYCWTHGRHRLEWGCGITCGRGHFCHRPLATR